MLSIHRRTGLVLAASLTVSGFLVGSSGLRPAQAGHIIGAATYQRDFVTQQFAAEAAHIGALRGVNTAAYLHRFTALARQREKDMPGQQTADGTVLVNNWTISPAGTLGNLGDFPANAVRSPDGAHMLVVNSGSGVQSVQIVNLADSTVAQTIPYYAPQSAFLGAAYSPDGKSAYVTGGGQNVVHFYAVAADGTLTANGDVVLGRLAPDTSTNPFPTGVSVSRDNKTLYVANSLANTVTIIDVASKSVTATVKVGTAPYTTLVDPSTGAVYVSNWGDATVSVIDPVSRAVTSTINVGRHPTAMVFGQFGLLYVSDSNSDAISIVNTQSQQETARLPVITDPNAPYGSSPEGLAVSPDGGTIYVADAGDNAVAVFRVRPDGAGGYFQGWIPTAWYPTAVVVSADGSKLFVTNGFGMRDGPNNGPLYPNPTRLNPGVTNAVTGRVDSYCNCAFDQYSGSMNIGLLSTIPVPTHGQLTNDSLQVFKNDHFFDASPLDRTAGNPIPQPGGTSPIKHVIYIVKENRTYDQVFGDESLGNGDPALALFPREVTPNLHALAERFGLLDNFYADAQVSADGHNWALSANASDYTEKNWPQTYSVPPGRNFGYPFEGGTALPQSAGGYLWDDAAVHNVSYRDYGLYTAFNFPLSTATTIPQSQSCAGPVTHVYQGVAIPAGDVLCFPPTVLNANGATAPNLVGHLDPRMPPYDTRWPDVERVADWKQEFDQYVANDNLPQLELIRLSQDHTSGTRPGSWTPQYMASDNDAAVGQLVDTVSHSKFWASTAIFVTEDDAQNGPDHVDSHRTETLVISPYTAQARPRAEDAHYDTAALIRTIELILGMKPMSQFDATAMPMWQMFGSTPDTTPFTALPQGVATQFNGSTAYGARLSAKMSFALPDQAPPDLLNRILWHAIKGANVPYPTIHGAVKVSASQVNYTWGAMEQHSLVQAHLTGVPMPHIIGSRVLSTH